MERAKWLKHMREMTEALYDHISPGYWVKFGLYENEAQQEFLQKFLGRIGRNGTVLSAACGADRYNGMLLEEKGTGNGYDHYVVRREQETPSRLSQKYNQRL